MKIQNEISELHSGSFVSGHLNNILGKLPFMANGGFLRNGQAVVAEAGPELLEIVNGGVRVIVRKFKKYRHKSGSENILQQLHNQRNNLKRL